MSDFTRAEVCAVAAAEAFRGDGEIMASPFGLIPMIGIRLAKLTFSRNDKPNRVAHHDLGLAAGNLLLEATARGLFVHQMGGIVPERARELYVIPDDCEPVTALAIGYRGDPADAPDELAERDRAPRSRRPLREFVFTERWGDPAPFTGA